MGWYLPTNILMEAKQFYLSGIEQMKLGNYDTAFHVFSDAIEQFPANADFYSERGVARFHLNDFKGALNDMDKALELEPDKPYRYSSRAFIKDALKDVHGAIADYKKAIELDPEDDIAYNNLGLLEEKLGFGKMAQTHFEKADQLAETRVKERVGQEVVEIGSAGEQLIESFKNELNLEVIEDQSSTAPVIEENEKKSIWKVAFSIFHSKKALRDYLHYLKDKLG